MRVEAVPPVLRASWWGQRNSSLLWLHRGRGVWQARGESPLIRKWKLNQHVTPVKCTEGGHSMPSDMQITQACSTVSQASFPSQCVFHTFFFFSLTSLLEYNCFTMLCQFLLYNKVNQLYIYIYPHNLSLLRLPPTLPIPPLQVVTKHRADLPVLCSFFPLAIYFTFGSVYMSMPLFFFILHCQIVVLVFLVN